MKRRTFGRRDHRGAAIVETAVVLPVVVMFLFGVLEYGRFLAVRHVADNAAREGVRYALAHTQPATIGGVTKGNADSDVINAVTAKLAGLSLQSQTIQVYKSDVAGNNIGAWTGAQFGQRICVRIKGKFPVVGPTSLLLPSTISMDVKSIMRSEAN